MSTSKPPKQEVIKRDKDGLDVWDDIKRFARDGFGSIPEADLERLKWFGAYVQRPKDDGFFMVRIKIPGGRLSSSRLREIGLMTNQYARGVGDISTRQDIQIHWVRIENLPELLGRIYHKMNMYQEFSCGDAPRNVTACPLAGIDRDAIVDTGGLAQAVSDMYRTGGKEFSNLPRKFKTAIGGCRLHCHEPQINDAGFFGATRERDGRTEAGLGLLVGGGLRDTPHFGQSLRVFLQPDAGLLRDVSRRIANLFCNADELRRGRLRARLKFLVDRIGWEAFRDLLEGRLGYALEHDDSIVFPLGASHGDHMGVGQQADGLCRVGVPIPRGRFTGDDMIALADLARDFAGGGEGALVTTIKQNIILLNILPDRVDELCRALEERGLPPQVHPLRESLLSCTGLEFCRLAVVETKQRAAELLEYLERRLEPDEPVMISVTGCPNSCTQYQIADIGLHGVPVVHEGQRQEGFYFLLGGKIGADPQFARFVVGADGKKLKVPATRIHLVIEKLLTTYNTGRRPGENFSDWAGRLDPTESAGLIGSCIASDRSST